MTRSNFKLGDLVEILVTDLDTPFKAHNNLLNGKLGLIIREAPKDTMLDLWYVLVEGKTTSVLGKHLRKAKLNDKR
jgi:ATP-dependent exoDNAse (exonuclease V) alpha subunit